MMAETVGMFFEVMGGGWEYCELNRRLVADRTAG